jgi:hypothetical protein
MAKFRMSNSRMIALTTCFLAGLAIGGCAQSSSTVLPDLKRSDTKDMLTPAQQQQAIAELARKKAEQEAKALKDIQSTR